MCLVKDVWCLKRNGGQVKKCFEVVESISYVGEIVYKDCLFDLLMFLVINFNLFFFICNEFFFVNVGGIILLCDILEKNLKRNVLKKFL